MCDILDRDIKELLPHREPFIFVDEILSISEDEITTLKTFKGEEEFFRGHFPGNPIVPGVLLVEVMAQTAGLLVSNALKGGDLTENVGTLFYLSRVIDVKFKVPVVPGDVVKTNVIIIGVFGDAVKRATAEVSGRIVALGELVLSRVDIKKGGLI